MIKDLVRTLAPHESIITTLLVHDADAVTKFLRTLTNLESMVFQHNWHYTMRPMQVSPDGEWNTWVLQGGRGVGKTRPGAEQVIAWAKELGQDYGAGAKIALIGKDPADARDVMIEGESGILKCSPPWFRPRYEPSKRRLTWPNGVIGLIYSSETPDDLRGPNLHKGWIDEFCKFRYAQELWDMYQFALRAGVHPQTIITTTPRPIPVYKEIVNDPGTVVTRGKTDDNYANLSPNFIRTVYNKYKGTRLGRQELDAELLSDTPGALWTLDMIDKTRVVKMPCPAIRIVVAIDPSANDGDDDTLSECGITVDAKGDDGHGYLLHDFSGSYSPAKWGEIACVHYAALQADKIIGEVNNGGAMVESVIQSAAATLEMTVAYKAVRASRGKLTRAEPVSALYEQQRYHHVGTFPDLEDQMTTWVPGMKSPDRMDAHVWGATEIMLLGGAEFGLS
jgi:phage terminase large subunit-like protein